MKTAIMKLASGVFFITALISSVWAGEPLALYDNFNSNFINPNKWFGRTGGAGAGLQTLEEVRLIILGNLNLLTRTYANTTTNDGDSYNNQGLGFINPSSIKAIKTSIRVIGFELNGCSNGDTTSRVRARIHGNFFNADVPTPGSAMNDVIANIALIRQIETTDSPSTLQVIANIARCLDASCLQFDSLNETSLGTASVGQNVTLRLELDKNHHQFIVQRDSQPEILIPYYVLDSSPPGAQSKRLEVGSWMANCTAQPRPTGFISALFDNVYVNASALNTQ
ncbi:MAG: hypothetical protein V9H25_08350 [Candidatus Competibacter sp.]